ncbi:fat-body protein 1 isoform X2 [Drosophila erecta]|uniref:Fat-body protein 1 n=1 Tax=Drosophila erecta TaxID=7220 RepID=B3ND14_DROER|nr:fat-body protein 1 isoform X2 [Drosophila erecta]EDV51736.2 uncharacterized protein Dere_GG13736 [Drosophila erecta]
MNRILLLVAFAASVVAAARIPTNPDRVQTLDRFSLEDLQRQKFILDIVKNIRQPLQQIELINLDVGLVADGQRYYGGIDELMQSVIDLDRQRGLVDEHHVYSVGRSEDVKQLRGIYRLLVRAQDFDTFSRNVVYLRRNINPVLLLNALALAIRDRVDTQKLILPAVQELLPELYLDEEVIQQVRGAVREQTPRPSLMDIVGTRQRASNPLWSMLMPWREIHMQMAQRKQQPLQKVFGQKRVVVRVDSQGQLEKTSLLTDDIELQNLVQNLIQEIALLEDVTQVGQRQRINNQRGAIEEGQWIGRNRVQFQDNNQERYQGQDADTGRLLRVSRRRLLEQQDQDQGQSIYGNQNERFQRLLRRDDDNDDDDQDIRLGRVQLQRGISQGYLGARGVRNLPTVSVNSDRLLHVSRRRLNAIQQNQEQDQLNGRQRFIGLVGGERLSERRRVGQLDDVRQERPINRQRQNIAQAEEEQNYNFKQGRNSGAFQQERQTYADQLESVSRDDERLVHINRRRLNQDNQNNQDIQQQQIYYPRRINSIGEGRRVIGGRPIQDEDILKLIRGENRLKLMTDDEILDMLKRNRQQRQQNHQYDDDDDDNNDDEDVVRRQGLRNRRSLSTSRQQNDRRSEILLHNLRQLVARLNQESIAQEEQFGQKEIEQYALHLNQIQIDAERSREVFGQIGLIEQRLKEVLGQGQVNVGSLRGQMIDEVQVESLIADVLLGRRGPVGIMTVIRQMVRDNSGEQSDRTGLGIRISDPIVQLALRQIIRVADEQRDQILGAYRQEQLQMRGVSINDVRVDQLRTRIEEYDLDLSNLVEQQDRGIQQEVVGRQRRLNNKAFTIDMDITSDQDQEAIIRVFLGPTEDEWGRQRASLDERRRDFVLLDAIQVQLESGRNRIQHRSIDIPWTTRDVTPLVQIYRQVMLQLNGQQGQQVLGIQQLVGENGRFPQNLLLPSGRPNGLPMQLLVVVSPLAELQVQDIVPEVTIGIGSASLQDARPLGYPLDRPIRSEQELLQLTNVLLKDVVITQEN